MEKNLKLEDIGYTIVYLCMADGQYGKRFYRKMEIIPDASELATLPQLLNLGRIIGYPVSLAAAKIEDLGQKSVGKAKGKGRQARASA